MNFLTNLVLCNIMMQSRELPNNMFPTTTHGICTKLKKKEELSTVIILRNWWNNNMDWKSTITWRHVLVFRMKQLLNVLSIEIWINHRLLLLHTINKIDISTIILEFFCQIHISRLSFLIHRQISLKIVFLIYLSNNTSWKMGPPGVIMKCTLKQCIL